MNKQKQHLGQDWVLVAVFFVLSFFIVYVIVISQASDVTTSANISNQPPVIASVFVNDSLNERVATYNSGATPIIPTSNSITEIHVNGVVTDANGVGSSYETGDVTDVTAVFYISSNSAVCSSDKNDCYRTSACTFTPNTSTSMYYDCQFNLAFWIDSSSPGGADSSKTWVVTVEVTDRSLSQDLDSNVNTMEVATMVSLSIPTAINFGTLARSESTTSDTNAEITLTQFGNDVTDVDVKGTAMACTILGEIAVGDQEWALTDVSHGTVGSTSLTDTAVDTDFAIGYRTSESIALTKKLYWNVVMPDAVSGTCTGTVTMTAFSS